MEVIPLVLKIKSKHKNKMTDFDIDSDIESLFREICEIDNAFLNVQTDLHRMDYIPIQEQEILYHKIGRVTTSLKKLKKIYQKMNNWRNLPDTE
jgi:DNA relaxase NicK